MNSQIDEFERIMLDYLKGEISSEDMQKLTILLKRENACREKYREIARSYALWHPLLGLHAGKSKTLSNCVIH